MSYQSFLIATFFIAEFIHFAKGSSCGVKVEKIGCFNDRSRPLDKLVVYRRLTYNYKTQDTDLPRLLCDCAIKAHKYGYHYIGLQYYAECWSSNKTKPNYDRDGPSTNKCVNPEFETCAKDDQVCVGGELASLVYKIVHAGTDVNTSEVKGTSPATDVLSPSQETPSENIKAPSTVLPSTAVTKPPCNDKNVECPKLRSYCSERYQNMLRQCAKTCQQCK